MLNMTDVILLDSVDSTNDFLRREKKLLAREFISVRTKVQTSGRGRNGRTWSSVPGRDLAFSTVFHGAGNMHAMRAVSVHAGIAVTRALKCYISPERISIKWPNDVFCDGKKICGILCEMIPEEGLLCAVIGIGINVNSTFRNSDEDFISLMDAVSSETDIAELHERVMSQIRDVFAEFSFPVKDIFLQEWHECNCSVGREVCFTFDNSLSEGKVLRMNPDCSLAVLFDSGKRVIDCIENVIFK